MNTRFEHSAGGVVLRSGPTGPEVVLASRRTMSGGLAWGLPKGLVEPGERPEAAALREVREETGVVAKIRRHSCLVRPIHLDGRLSIRCPLASLE